MIIIPIILRVEALMISLKEPIPFNSVQQSIPVSTSNDAVTIAAWQFYGFGESIHDGLQKLHAQTIPPEECQKYHENIMLVDKSEVCTLIIRGKESCQGDSGSGLILDKDRRLIWFLVENHALRV
ncbi:chymotrypsin-1-like [Solenopsis invicta]|uniref:chymotrypsin-1-like n=1 Tax=Solenopsis invicta TaxID=13686 RepID=UPI00193E6DA5|nr:chymotrypsin-1-like [Solenopsis invicta]